MQPPRRRRQGHPVDESMKGAMPARLSRSLTDIPYIGTRRMRPIPGQVDDAGDALVCHGSQGTHFRQVWVPVSGTAEYLLSALWST